MLGDLARWAGPADLPEPEHDPEQARRLADEVLSRPEYRWEDPADDPIQRALDWLGERIGDLLSAPSGGGGSLLAAVVWTALAGLVVLIAVLVWRRRRLLAASGRAGERGGRVVVTRGETPVDWDAAAASARAEERWRDALRCGYRALVVRLAAAGALGDLAGRTAGELAGELSATRPAATGPFAAATELFEATWYGGAPAGPDEAERLDRLTGEVRDRARAPVRAQAAGRAGTPAGGRSGEPVAR